jgi:hypothetical protein
MEDTSPKECKKCIFKTMSKKTKIILAISFLLLALSGALVWFFLLRETEYVLDTAQTYDYEGKTIKQDVHITVGGVKIKDAIIEGDLYIDATVGDGEVEIENVIAKGKTYIYGGGKDTVLVIGGTIYEALGEFNGRIHAINWATMERIEIKSSDMVIQTDKESKVKKVELVIPQYDEEKDKPVELNGNFDEVVDNGVADITIKKDTVIQKFKPICMGSGCIASERVSRVIMEEGSNIQEAVVNEPMFWEGEGTIDNMDVQAEGVVVDVEVTEFPNEEYQATTTDVDPAFVGTPERTGISNSGDYVLRFKTNDTGTIYYILQPYGPNGLETPTAAQIMEGTGNAVCGGPNDFDCAPTVASSGSVEVTEANTFVEASGYYGDSFGVRPEGDMEGSTFESFLFAVFVNEDGEESSVVKVEL